MVYLLAITHPWNSQEFHITTHMLYSNFPPRNLRYILFLPKRITASEQHYIELCIGYLSIEIVCLFGKTLKHYRKKWSPVYTEVLTFTVFFASLSLLTEQKFWATLYA